ncbi:hypothetical protein [Microbacterium dextranolyticum]|uniref:Uncharacterized protein n=1 Tax=Microbacterium dextranolyticum TaxID=36806 RepID=A0A9W6HLM5_9MICO|nr:hypothetical protein [Microbacterium dextranolyticum]MBM7461559.1 hypothetical protein [Microbacterium dextranolyticum]GLJ94798.1 hypothetical protein GCM10017591_08600 [Microbacterium dextranolyticum]
MDPIWSAVAEFWWIGPSVIGAGALGWIGLRGQRTAKARRLAYDASLEALRTARRDALAARASVRVARAELTRTQAERAAGRASGADVEAARRDLDIAQRETRAATATMRARRASVSADRVAIRRRGADPAQFPLAQLMAADDALSARFLEYETDPARLLAFPAMTDVRVPATAAFHAELRATRALRPSSPNARITPAQFSAYRDGVARLSRALDAAEAEAWRRARADGSAPAGPGPDTAATAPWLSSAQEIAQNLTQTILTRGAEALARATAPRAPEQAPRAGDRGAPGDDADGHRSTGPQREASAQGATHTPHAPQPAPEGPTRAPDPSAATPPAWPIPSRKSRPDRS